MEKAWCWWVSLPMEKHFIVSPCTCVSEMSLVYQSQLLCSLFLGVLDTKQPHAEHHHPSDWADCGCTGWRVQALSASAYPTHAACLHARQQHRAQCDHQGEWTLEQNAQSCCQWCLHQVRLHLYQWVDHQSSAQVESGFISMFRRLGNEREASTSQTVQLYIIRKLCSNTL